MEFSIKSLRILASPDSALYWHCCLLIVDLLYVHATAASICERDDAQVGVHFGDLLQPLVAGAAGLEGIQVTVVGRNDSF
jgi:hypothetical protein